jgi:predicted negative regulator of RcsB-dependent stress response
MAKKRYTHQQIRKTIKRDELRDGLDKLVHYAKTNTENLLIAVIIGVVIVVLIPLYFRHQAGNELRAANLLDRGLSYDMQPVDAQGAVLGRGFKSLEEKYQKTRDAFAEVTSTYRGTQAARLAGMGQANSQFWAKQYDKALAAYQSLLAEHKQDFWTPTLQERVGACQENLKQWQDALNTYQALLVQTPDYFNHRAVRVAEARCLFHLGKTKEARELLQAEMKIEPGSYWAEQARQQSTLFGE